MNNIIRNIEDSMNSNPAIKMSENELDDIILKMGSFLSIISNKKINQAKLLIMTVKDKYFRQLFQEIAEIDNLQLLVRSIIDRYPTICRSKIVITALKVRRK
jgi:hypothetical protein